MRVEEINRWDVGNICKHWDEGRTHPETPHVPMGMVGRFKRTVGEKKYVQPLAIRSVSGLEYRLWMYHMLTEYERVGVKAGPVFWRPKKKLTDPVARVRVRDINLLLHPVLLRIRARLSDLIREDVNVEDEYSSSHSLKRGATGQAQNMDVPTEVSRVPGQVTQYLVRL
jgi:hypothetical protein